jgi:hypothetical protein
MMDSSRKAPALLDAEGIDRRSAAIHFLLISLVDEQRIPTQMQFTEVAPLAL